MDTGTVMKRPAFRRCAARLARLAALLLALLPAAGRLASATAHHALAQAITAPASGGTAAMAVHAVHHQVATSAQARRDQAAAGRPASAPELAPPAAPGPQPDGDGDCDYCPLLAALLILPAPRASVVGDLLPHPAHVHPDVPRVAHRHPTGLGSRGPPRTA